MTSHHLADATTWAGRAAEEATAGSWEAASAAAAIATALAGIAHAAAAEDGLALVEANSCTTVEQSFEVPVPGPVTPDQMAEIAERIKELGRPPRRTPPPGDAARLNHSHTRTGGRGNRWPPDG